MIKFFTYLFQPSTIKGLSLLIGSASISFNPDMLLQISTGIAAVYGAVETIRNESTEKAI